MEIKQPSLTPESYDPIALFTDFVYFELFALVWIVVCLALDSKNHRERDSDVVSECPQGLTTVTRT